MPPLSLTVRIHYHIQDGGQVVNVVPDYSKLWVRVRDSKRTGMLPVYEQVKKMAEGAAIMANVDYKISLISGIYEVLVNRAGGEIMQNNLELLGPLAYTAEETAFGKKIQEATGKPQVGMDSAISPLEETKENPGGGSTDVGDVSWNVPNINLGVTVAPKDTPWHSWAVVACGGMSIGHKGMVHAAKALGMTAVDLLDVLSWTRNYLLPAILLSFFADLSPEERIQILDTIYGVFCRHCGIEHPEGRKCQCDNDE